VPGRQALQHLEQQVLTPQLVAQCGACALANIIHASAHLRAASVIASLLPVFMGQLQEADPQNVASTLWAVATMGQRVTEQQLQQLVAALVSKLEHANPQDVANTLWAVATMGQRVTEQQLQQLVAALVSKLEQANPQDVANTL
jgi:uncharacterized protein YneF (UPF0154 family)